MISRKQLRVMLRQNKKSRLCLFFQDRALIAQFFINFAILSPHQKYGAVMDGMKSQKSKVLLLIAQHQNRFSFLERIGLSLCASVLKLPS
jgi:hypothetical protein